MEHEREEPCLHEEEGDEPHPRECTCRDPGFLNHDCPIHGEEEDDPSD